MTFFINKTMGIELEHLFKSLLFFTIYLLIAVNSLRIMLDFIKKTLTIVFRCLPLLSPFLSL